MSYGDVIRRMVEDGLEGAIGRYYSSYRARVVDNDDPQRQDRVRVVVQRLNASGEEPLAAWAYPKLAGVTGEAGAGSSEVPPVGAFVWVEFEDGQIDKPIYTTGGWWGKREKPDAFASLDWRGWVSRKGHRFLRHDPEQGSGEMVWQHADGQSIRQLEGGALEIKSGQSVARVEGSKITLSTGAGQTIVMEGSKITISAGANVEIKAAQIALDASIIKLGGNSAFQPLVLGFRLAQYLTTLVIWLATHAHASPGSPPVVPPPPFFPASILSTKSKTS